MEQKRVNKLPAKNAPSVRVKRPNAVASQKNSAHPIAHRSVADIPKLDIITKTNKEKKPFPLATVAAVICFTFMFLFLVMNYTTLDELKDEVVRQDKQITQLTEKKDKLEEKVAKKDNLDEITKYAENELGMVKKEEVEFGPYYIDLNTDDEVQITEYEDETENGLGVLLTGVGNVLKGFFSN